MKLYSLLLSCALLMSSPLNSFVNAKPGTNIWVLDKGIADTVDIIQSFVTDIDSKLDTCCSLVNSKLDNLSCTGSCNIASVLEEIGVVESKLDNCCSLINSKLDTADACAAFVIHQSDFVAGTFTINIPGRYCLAEDVMGTIVTNTDSVCIDLNCHQIVNTTNSAIIIESNHVSISNGTILEPDFLQSFTGIVAVNANIDISISNVSIFGWQTGAAIINTDTVVLQGIKTVALASLRESIQNNTGVDLTGSFNIDIRDCLFNDCSSNGCYFEESFGVVANTQFNTNFFGAGCVLVNSAVELTQCSASGNSTGYFIDNSTSNLPLLQNCSANGNFGTGFSVNGGSAGIIQQCIAEKNFGAGFATDGASPGFKFYNNVACQNSPNYSLVFDAPVTSAVNAHGGYNIACDDLTPDQILVIESKLDNCCSILNSKLDHVGIASVIETIGVVESKLDNCCNLINSKLDNLDACAAFVIHQSDFVAGTFTIDIPGRYCLAEDVHGMIVTNTDNVCLDLNCHQLTNSSNSAIVINSNHVSISNGTVFEPDLLHSFTGIIGGGVADITISDVSLYGWQTGLALTFVDTVVLQGIKTGFGFIAITNITGADIEECFNLDIRDCTFNDCNSIGLYLSQVGTGIIADSQFNNNGLLESAGTGTGCILDNGIGIELVNCRAAENLADGFAITQAGSGILMRDCSASENLGVGFLVDVTALTHNLGNIIQNCVAQTNHIGFKRNPLSTGFKFYNNVACNNDINYQSIDDAPVTSAANALGADNIDCSSSDLDQINVIESKLDHCCSLVNSKLDHVIDEAIIVESKIDNCCALENSKLDVINSKLDNFEGSCPVFVIHQSDINDGLGTFTINQPGKYCLATDIVGTIAINTNVVCLDLNCHALKPLAGTVGVKFITNAIDVSIANGVIIDADLTRTSTGIDASAVTAQNINIENIALEDLRTGIALSNSNTVRLRTIRTNHTNNTSLQNLNGLTILGVTNLDMRDCHIDNNVVHGALITGTDIYIADSSFNSNTPGGGTIGAINLTINQATILNCSASDNNTNGFVIAGQNIVVRDCQAFNNNGTAGFEVTSATNLDMINCIAKGNAVDGFFFISGYGTIQQCTAEGNGNFGFLQLVGSNYQFYQNVACHNGPTAPFNQNYSNITTAPVTSPANALGADNIDCSNSDLDQIDVIESKLDAMDACGSTPIYQKNFSAGVYTINKSGNYCLAENVTGKITISADNVCLNLNCRTVTNTTDSAIEVDSNNVSVSNGTLQGTTGFFGINTGTALVNLVFSNILLSGWSRGIYCNESAGCIIENIRTDLFTPITDTGIYLDIALEVVIRNCELLACGNVGLYMRESADVIVENSLFNENVNIGCEIDTNSGPARIVNCTASLNQKDGFLIDDGNTEAILIQNCYATGNNAGFNVVGSVANGIIQNCIASENNYGFEGNVVNSSVKYYNNIACKNAVQNYRSIYDAPVTSAANAHGAYNIDCSNTTRDCLEALCSKLAVLG